MNADSYGPPLDQPDPDEHDLLDTVDPDREHEPLTVIAIRQHVDLNVPRSTAPGQVNAAHVATEQTLRELHGHPRYVPELDGPGNFLPCPDCNVYPMPNAERHLPGCRGRTIDRIVANATAHPERYPIATGSELPRQATLDEVRRARQAPHRGEPIPQEGTGDPCCSECGWAPTAADVANTGQPSTGTYGQLAAAGLIRQPHRPPKRTPAAMVTLPEHMQPNPAPVGIIVNGRQYLGQPIPARSTPARDAGHGDGSELAERNADTAPTYDEALADWRTKVERWGGTLTWRDQQSFRAGYTAAGRTPAPRKEPAMDGSMTGTPANTIENATRFETDDFGVDQAVAVRIADLNPDDQARWLDNLTAAEARDQLDRLRMISREHRRRVESAELLADRIRQNMRQSAAHGLEEPAPAEARAPRTSNGAEPYGLHP